MSTGMSGHAGRERGAECKRIAIVVAVGRTERAGTSRAIAAATRR